MTYTVAPGWTLLADDWSGVWPMDQGYAQCYRDAMFAPLPNTYDCRYSESPESLAYWLAPGTVVDPVYMCGGPSRLYVCLQAPAGAEVDASNTDALKLFTPSGFAGQGCTGDGCPAGGGPSGGTVTVTGSVPIAPPTAEEYEAGLTLFAAFALVLAVIWGFRLVGRIFGRDVFGGGD